MNVNVDSKTRQDGDHGLCQQPPGGGSATLCSGHSRVFILDPAPSRAACVLLSVSASRYSADMRRGH